MSQETGRLGCQIGNDGGNRLVGIKYGATVNGAGNGGVYQSAASLTASL